MPTRNLRFVLPFLLLAAILAAQEKVDLSVIHRIRTEAFENSKVMDHVFFLTDVHGPRLTGSPGYGASGDWAVKRLQEYGLENVKLDKWPWGRGWASTRFSMNLIEPQHAPLIGVPMPWSPGLNGRVTGEPVLAPAPSSPNLNDAELEKYFASFRGKLKGRIVLSQQPRELALHSTPESRRYTDQDLANEALALDGAPQAFRGQPGVSPGLAGPRPRLNREETRRLQAKLDQFYREEGVTVLISQGRGDGATVFATGSAVYRDAKLPLPIPQVALSSDHYNRLVRLLTRKIPVRLEIEMETKFIDDSPHGFNVLAEIPGGRKKDEVVIVGAHLDSWTGGTGATDNAAGSAVVMEVVRILKTLDLKMDRTVRLALWGGEEGGFVGSRNYVKEHLADRETMSLRPGHAKLAAYFNLDNGTGKVRGIYLQQNDMVRPIFEAWLAPFKDLGATTITIRNTTGTDHLSFDEVGLPGFQFIQDPLEYDSRTHHSNLDVYDRIQAGDLRQASAIMASFAYQAATRDQPLPRKPLPKPSPRREGRAGSTGN